MPEGWGIPEIMGPQGRSPWPNYWEYPGPRVLRGVKLVKCRPVVSMDDMLDGGMTDL
jgi:hypothetical protein